MCLFAEVYGITRIDFIYMSCFRRRFHSIYHATNSGHTKDLYVQNARYVLHVSYTSRKNIGNEKKNVGMAHSKSNKTR